MGLKEAGELWLQGKIDKRLKPRTLEACTDYINRLQEFFGDVMLADISAGSLLAYTEWRSKTAGVSRRNHEINALSQMLKRAGLWEKIRYNYKPEVDVEWKPPKVYTADEEQRIFAFAKDDPNLELVEIVSLITRYTSASGSELRLMHLRNLHDLFEGDRPRVDITGDCTKNQIRPRTIPLVPPAREAFQRAVHRANRLGAHMPYHCLFPLRVNRACWNPLQPASRSWLRKQTAILRTRTGIPHIKPHTWRHQLTTEMLERGVPPETVKKICGWASEKMLETYGHSRYEAKEDALLLTLGLKKPVQPIAPRDNVITFPRQYLQK